MPRARRTTAPPWHGAADCRVRRLRRVRFTRGDARSMRRALAPSRSDTNVESLMCASSVRSSDRCAQEGPRRRELHGQETTPVTWQLANEPTRCGA